MPDLEKLKRRLGDLRGLRQPHESLWVDCMEHVHPLRASGFFGNDGGATEAQAKKALILDSTATDSARILTSALMTGLTPPNSVWFALDVGTESDDERRWLDDTADVIFKNIHAGNFDATGFECCTDVVDAGWFVMYVDEAKEGGYRFEQWPLSECFISSSTSGGVVDTVFRDYVYTTEQCVSEFGVDTVSEKVREAYRTGKLSEPVKLCHAIEPRSVYLTGAQVGKNMAFASHHFELDGGGTVLRESGYPEFPCAAPRWMLIPRSCYGTGPVSDALPDIKTLNQLKRMELSSLELAIAGMWKATDDGVLNPSTVKVGPKRIIVVNDIANFVPLTSGVDFNIAFMAAKELQSQIRKILLADQLQPQDGPAMTATEVQVRVQMIRQLLGPVYGRLQSEYLQPLIDRCFGIVYRLSQPMWDSGLPGIIGKPPASLAGRNFHVKYISPLARAQKMEEVNAIDLWLAPIVQRAAELQDPSQLDIVDLGESDRLRGEGLGVPNKAMLSSDAIQAKRDARAKAQQTAQQQQAALQTQQETASAMAQKAVAA